MTQVRLGLAKVGRTGLDCVIDSVAGTRDSRGVIRHGARLCRQTVLDALKLFILLAEQIDGRYNARVNFLGTCRRVIDENFQVPITAYCVDRRLERLERVVDAGGRRCDRARQLANRSVRGADVLVSARLPSESALESEATELPAVARASPSRSLPWEIACVSDGA